ncbi:MAG: hypothetical protein U0412_12105 [Nitrospira sp.]
MQQSRKTPSPYIGSAMALLATLQEADVLPPEGTREANLIIKSVIQFQSVFMKSQDNAVQTFARAALQMAYGDQAESLFANLPSTGWTAEFLSALSDEEGRRTADELETLALGFLQFNLSVNDFHRFMHLVREAHRVFDEHGSDFRSVFVRHRKDMPGAAAG